MKVKGAMRLEFQVALQMQSTIDSFCGKGHNVVLWWNGPSELIIYRPPHDSLLSN